jgi:hypothetical protein
MLLRITFDWSIEGLTVRRLEEKEIVSFLHPPAALAIF